MSDTYERGALIDTFGGVLNHYFEPPHLLYEVNSQAKANHLDLRELYKMGGVLAFSAAKYLHRDIKPVHRLFRDIRVKRRKRKILVERYQPLRKMGLFDIRAPLDAEQYLWALPDFERIYLKEKRNGEVIKDEAPWLNKLYRQEGVTPENVPEFGLE